MPLDQTSQGLIDEVAAYLRIKIELKKLQEAISDTLLSLEVQLNEQAVEPKKRAGPLPPGHIKAIKDSTKPLSELATIMGVSRSTIYRIKTNQYRLVNG